MQLCHSNITSMKSAATKTKCTHSVVGNLALERSSVITQKKCRLFDVHVYTYKYIHVHRHIFHSALSRRWVI